MKILLAALLSAVLVSCSTFKDKTKTALDAFERRDFATAETIYGESCEEEGADQLLYLYERAMARHNLGNYEGSIKDLLLADKLSEIKDYTSIAEEAAAIITTEQIKQYRGEEFETVLISTYLALNYALEGKLEDAIVECRRVNRKLELLRSEAKRTYNLNAFAQYLSGVLYEKEGNWNSAYVDYKKTWDLKSEFSPLRLDLLRGAIKNQSESERDRWRRYLKASPEEFKEATKSLKEKASLIVIYQNGHAPEKIQSPKWAELPEYSKRYNKFIYADVFINGQVAGKTELLYDIEDVAIKNLKEKYAALIAKRTAGVAAKVLIGEQVKKQTGSNEAGTLVQLGLLMLSKPDLRAWMTLPQNLQALRLNLPPGEYEVSLRPHGAGDTVGEQVSLGKVNLTRAGQVELLNYRSLNHWNLSVLYQ